MIKQIQLRGISRNPSDRMVNDGGCTESLNVQMDSTEIAPACSPEDITESRVGQAALAGTDDYIYIHKGDSYTNYITLSGAAVKAYINGNQTDAIVTFAQGETFRSASSVGNTLLLVTDRHIHYVLFKDSTYIYLGTKIPEPKVNFVATPVVLSQEELEARQKTYEDAAAYRDAVAPAYVMTWDADTWNDYFSKYATEDKPTGQSTTYHEFIDAFNDYIWYVTQQIIYSDRYEDTFPVPVFARYAVKLYDGTYIYQSVPYLLHTGKNQFVVAKGLSWDGTRTGREKILEFDFSEYKASAEISYDLGNWGDIVRSVDIFLSTDCCNPAMYAKIDGAKESSESGVSFEFKFLGQQGREPIEDLRDEMLSKTLFYKVESKEASEIGAGLIIELKPYSQDELVVKERLTDDELSFHETTAAGQVIQYNQRVIFSGLQTRLTSGYRFLQSVVWKQGQEIYENSSYYYIFKIKAADGTTYKVLGRNEEGGIEFPVQSREIENNTYLGIPCGWLYYPDPRCDGVEIYFVSEGSENALLYTVPMKEHPGLNGSYALCSLAEPVTSLKDNPATAQVPTATDENPLMSSDKNILSVSELSNPFLLPASGKVTFDDDIIATATTTIALSSGQFGQFPLYVFTKGGIWAVELDNMGLPVSSKPLSRDVATSADGITPIDQAIVFTTDKSVMLLEGSRITDLSPYMTGRQFTEGIPDPVLTNIGIWSPLSDVLLDGTPFMKYMEDAKCLYDYPGRRLIFFSKSHASFQYVYKLDSQTWHKLAITDGSILTSMLNSYPEALASVVKENDVRRILNFSTNLKTAVTTLKGAIITRPLALDNSDVRKVIRAIRFRGFFHAGHVKYKLLGSMDGLNWGELRTLHGGSYKLFRLLILTDMQVPERLSYIDIDFETRFTNKLR